MTILSALQPAMIRLVGRKPTTIYSTQNQTELELGDLANEVAADIMKSHDWQALTKITNLAGDGTTTAFDLPSDYDRMVLASDIHDGASLFWDYTPAASVNQWMTLTTGGINAISPGWWILLGDRIQFFPAPTGNAPFAYVSRQFARSAPASGTGAIIPKASFTSDDDTFLMPERLITLGVVWRYREQKGMGYAEDMANFEMALSQAQARDKGSRVIRSNSRRAPAGVRAGWPWPLGGA